MSKGYWLSFYGESVPIEALPTFPDWRQRGRIVRPIAEDLRALFANDPQLNFVGHLTVLDGYVFNLYVEKARDRWTIEVLRHHQESYDFYRSSQTFRDAVTWERLSARTLEHQTRLPWPELAERYDRVVTDADVLREPRFSEYVEEYVPATVFDLFGEEGYDLSLLR
ncbi:MAG: hypothetical protein M3R02_11180 [Chloroflexota bacterium]|nr:hypothetical protein [Chloroflexota bacterium]